MQRRTAVAAASAISISLVSAVVALGANLGALGFARPTPASAPAAPVATQSTTANRSTPVSTDATREREGGESHDREREVPDGGTATTTREQGAAPTGARDD